MAKDYAKYNAKRRTNLSKLRGNGVLLICLFLILISGFSWIVVKKFPVSVMITNMKTWISHKNLNKNTVVAKISNQEKPPPVHFAFYNELPNTQVPVQSNITQTSAPAPEKLLYSLRFAEFKEETEASQMRLSLLLTGVDSEIIRVGDHFSVRQGNFSTLALAKAMQKKLEKKGIETVIEKY